MARNDEVNRHRAHLGAHPTSAAFKDRSLPTHLALTFTTLHSPCTHPRPLLPSSIMDSTLAPDRDLHLRTNRIPTLVGLLCPSAKLENASLEVQKWAPSRRASVLRRCLQTLSSPTPDRPCLPSNSLSLQRPAVDISQPTVRSP